MIYGLLSKAVGLAIVSSEASAKPFKLDQENFRLYKLLITGKFGDEEHYFLIF